MRKNRFILAGVLALALLFSGAVLAFSSTERQLGGIDKMANVEKTAFVDDYYPVEEAYGEYDYSLIITDTAINYTWVCDSSVYQYVTFTFFAYAGIFDNAAAIGDTQPVLSVDLGLKTSTSSYFYGAIFFEDNDFDIQSSPKWTFVMTFERYEEYFYMPFFYYSKTVPLPADPVKTGYTFVGWFYNDTFTLPYNGEPIYEDTRLYAKFDVITYGITYNLNDGWGVNNAQYNIESSTITLPTPTRTGYKFEGWYDNASFSGNAITQIPNGSIGNRTYWAKWSIITYTVTYNTNGGVAIDNGSFTYNDVYSLLIPSRDGYTFLGWFDNEGFTGNATTQIHSGSTGNRTYWAKWAVINYSITYNLNDGTGVSNRDYNIETDTITLPTPTRTGYKFEGWYDNASFGGSAITQLSSGSIGNRSYWAKWSVVTYTIVYNTNGGNAISNGSYDYNSPLLVLPTSSRDGYTFVGWFDNEELIGTAITQIYSGSTGNRTYWAKWSVIRYTITYDVNGGSAVANGDYDIETNTITLPTTSRTGYNFGGWFTSADFSGNAVTNIPKGSIGNKQFFAKWTAINYTITYNSNGGSAIGSGNYNIETSTITLLEPTRVGYTFVGWFDNVDLTGSAITQITKGSISNRTYWAKWVVTDFVIEYYLSGGSLAGAIENYTILSDTIILSNPSLVGHTFAGWFDNPNLVGNVVTSIPTGSTGDKMYFAKWIANKHTVTFIVDGEEYAVTEVDYGTKLENIPQVEVLMEAAKVFFAPSSYINGDMTINAELDPRLTPYIKAANSWLAFKDWSATYWWVLVLGGVALVVGIVFTVKKVRG